MFRRPSIRYGKTPEPETPYQRAAQVWDDRIGADDLIWITLHPAVTRALALML